MAKEIAVMFPGGKRVDASIDGRIVSTDQPLTAGGGGTAPAPFDLFAASLATCAGFYVLAFCQARGLPTEGLGLRQRIAFDETHRVRSIEIDISLPDGFPEKYRQPLLRAAEGCAVKRVIDQQPAFHVRTVRSNEMAAHA